MRKMLLFILVALSLSTAGYAALPPRGYISLYSDGARSYYAYCPIPPGYSIAKIEVWIWLLPSENGLLCADFAMGYPSNVIRDRIMYNTALISTSSGTLPTGYSTCLNVCQWDWCWVAHQALYVTSLQGTSIEIVPHPGLGVIQFSNCAPGHPAEPCLRGTSLFLNNNSYPCLSPELAIGAGELTWGAVKSLYGE
jgi:hypothetical protein